MEITGIPITEHPAFPYSFECGTCEGTGEGRTTTRCLTCKGQGSIKVIGAMFGRAGSIVWLTEPLPKKFPIRFPVPVPLREVQRYVAP